MGNFNDLPKDIMIDIFTRLPTETVLDCKSVSKTWRKVLQRPSFTQLHSEILLTSLYSSGSGSASACGGKFSFIFKMDEELYYLEYNHHDSSHKVKKLNLKPPFEIYGIVGSCNGLICLSGLPNHYTIDESSTASYVAYICNPITRQVVTLPELDRSTYYHLVDFMLCGFGYVAKTNEYKVVRLYTFRKYALLREEHEHKYEYKYAQIEVYTLGSGKGWRYAGKIDRETYPIDRRCGSFADGFIFWEIGKRGIVAFDLANEIVVEFDEPWIGDFWDGILGGHIYSAIYNNDESCKRSCDVWLLKKKKEDESSFRWCKEFSLINLDAYTISLARTTSGTVLCYSNMKLYLYDLKSSSSKVLEDFGRRVYNVVPHMNSLVSLVAFGEENTKALESGECAFEEAKVRDWKMKQP